MDVDKGTGPTLADQAAAIHVGNGTHGGPAKPADSPTPASAVPAAVTPAPAPAAEAPAPAAPAPAPAAPAPAPAPAAPVAAAPAPAPTAESATPTPGETPEQADKRVKDAQAKMHAATTDKAAATAALEVALSENAALRTKLETALAQPEFAPVAVPAETADLQQEINTITEEYFKAPEGHDKEALGKLLLKHGELTRKAALIEQQRGVAIQENQRRAVAATEMLRTHVSDFVTTVDPELPLPLFWAYKDQATAETPTELVVTAAAPDTPEKALKRLDWQTKRAIVLARQTLQPLLGKVRETAAVTNANITAAAAVMPGGSGVTPPAPAPAPPEKPASMVEQIRAMQNRAMPAG